MSGEHLVRKDIELLDMVDVTLDTAELPHTLIRASGGYSEVYVR